MLCVSTALRVGLAFAFFALASTGAFAATLQPIGGEVLINRGAGFERVTHPTVAGVGDSIMVNAEGSAAIVYNDQCSVPVKKGSVVTVAAEPPCQQAALIDSGTRMNLGASCTGKSFCEPPREDRHWHALVPITAIAVTAGLCIAEKHICDRGSGE